MMTLPVPVTTPPLRIAVTAPAGAGDDGRFADALATHLAERGASPQPRTGDAREHVATRGDDGPRPAPTADRRVDDEADRRTDRGDGSARSDRAHDGSDRAPERIGDRNPSETHTTRDDPAAGDDTRDAPRTESAGAGDVDNHSPAPDTGDGDRAEIPSALSDESAEPVTTTVVPDAAEPQARPAAPALATPTPAPDSMPAAPTAAGQVAPTAADQTVVRTSIADPGAQAATTTQPRAGSNHASSAAAGGSVPATAPAAAPAQTTPVPTATTNPAAAMAAALDAATSESGHQAGTPTTATTRADLQAGQPPTTASPPTVGASPPGAAANPAVAVAPVPTPATTAPAPTTTTPAAATGDTSSTTAPAPTTTTPTTTATPTPTTPTMTATPTPTIPTATATPTATTTPITTTTTPTTPATPTATTATDDGSVATATSTTQALSNPGVARGELTAPQRLAAVIAPEAGRMRGTVAHRTLEIRLDPPDLGTVDLEIRSSGSTVTVVARTESAEAMLAVLRQRDAIEASLRDLGLDLSGFDVSAGTPERDEAENRRGPTAAGAGTGSTTDTADLDATPNGPLASEGSVFL